MPVDVLFDGVDVEVSLVMWRPVASWTAVIPAVPDPLAESLNGPAGSFPESLLENVLVLSSSSSATVAPLASVVVVSCSWVVPLRTFDSVMLSKVGEPPELPEPDPELELDPELDPSGTLVSVIAN